VDITSSIIFVHFKYIAIYLNLNYFILKENACCILYAHWYLSNPFHLTIESNLTFIQNELWVPNGCHAHSKVLFLMFRISKRCHQDFSLMHTYHTCYTSCFGVKSSEKWLTCNVVSPNPYQFCKEIIWMSWTHLVFEPLSILSMSWAHTISWILINFK